RPRPRSGRPRANDDLVRLDSAGAAPRAAARSLRRLERQFRQPREWPHHRVAGDARHRGRRRLAPDRAVHAAHRVVAGRRRAAARTRAPEPDRARRRRSDRRAARRLAHGRNHSTLSGTSALTGVLTGTTLSPTPVVVRTDAAALQSATGSNI